MRGIIKAVRLAKSGGLVLAVFLASAGGLQQEVRAQHELTGLEVGLRLGAPSGVVAKLFMPDDFEAFELSLAQSSVATFVSLLYARHEAKFDVEGLRWYYGGGAMLSSSREENAIEIGAQGVLGLAYRLRKARFVFAVDWRPGIALLGISAATGTTNNAGLSIRWRL